MPPTRGRRTRSASGERVHAPRRVRVPPVRCPGYCAAPGSTGSSMGTHCRRLCGVPPRAELNTRHLACCCDPCGRNSLRRVDHGRAMARNGRWGAMLISLYHNKRLFPIIDGLDEAPKLRNTLANDAIVSTRGRLYVPARHWLAPRACVLWVAGCGLWLLCLCERERVEKAYARGIVFARVLRLLARQVVAAAGSHPSAGPPYGVCLQVPLPSDVTPRRDGQAP